MDNSLSYYWCLIIHRWFYCLLEMNDDQIETYEGYELRNRIRSIPPSCPVGNESDTIRVRHEADSTFGRILNRDTNSPMNRTRTSSNRENRTRNRRKETAGFT